MQEKILQVFAANGVQACEEEIDYYAWPQVFGNTAGPNGGIGGDAMTTFTVNAFHYNGTAVLLCGNKCKFIERFKPSIRF